MVSCGDDVVYGFGFVEVDAYVCFGFHWLLNSTFPSIKSCVFRTSRGAAQYLGAGLHDHSHLVSGQSVCSLTTSMIFCIAGSNDSGCCSNPACIPAW